MPGEPIQKELKKSGLKLADFPQEGTNDPELAVLIGADCYWKVVTGKVQRITVTSGHGKQLWMGLAKTSINIQCNRHHLYAHQPAGGCSDLKTTTCLLESLGIISEKTQNPDEPEALQSFKHALTYNDGRYQVELPWRPDKPDLPVNFKGGLKASRRN